MSSSKKSAKKSSNNAEDNKNDGIVSDFSKYMIVTADPISELLSNSVISKLNDLPTNISIYRTDMLDEFAINMIFTLYEDEEIRKEVYSIAYLPNTSNTIFIETENPEAVTAINKSFKLSKIEIDEFIPKFINFNLYRFYSTNKTFLSRVNVEPFKDEPCQILDINYKKKKAIVRLWSKLVKNTAAPLDEFTVTDSEAFNTTQKVYVSFDKTKYSSSGYTFKGNTFIGEFLLTKIELRNLLLWNSNLKVDEKARFDEPIPGLSIETKKSTQQFIQLEDFDPNEYEAVFTVNKPRFIFSFKSEQEYISSPYIYQFVYYNKEDFGVIIQADLDKIIIHTTENKYVELPFNAKLRPANEEGNCRDSQNKRIFINDVVKIIEGEYEGCDGYIMHAKKKLIFVNIYQEDKSILYCIESSKTKLIEDDEGIVDVPQ